MWTQIYNPLNNAVLSTVAAAAPAIILLGCITILRMRIHFAALLGLAVAFFVSIGIYKMPADAAVASGLYGAAFGILPIGWILLNVIFVYQLTVKCHLFDVLRHNLAAIAPDPRIQLILIAYSFGAFLEGIAGFGAPVAITATILIQLGFRPIRASALALIANTAPVAFGTLGIPITTLGEVTGLDLRLLSAMVERQLALFSLLIPFWIVATLAGWRAVRGIWPAALTAGLAFTLPGLLVANYHGPWLVGPVSGLCSVVALITLLRFWKPATLWSFDSDGNLGPAVNAGEPAAGKTEMAAPVENGSSSGCVTTSAEPATAVSTRVYDRKTVAKAWLPWIILTLFIFAWGTPQVATLLDHQFSMKIAVPHLHQLVQRMPPVVAAHSRPEPAIFKLNLLSTTGTGILAAAIIAAFVMGLSLRETVATYGKTFWQIRFSLLTIASMLALGNLSKYSGTDATLGLALAHTGTLYPFFGTLLGWLGVALTGSDTSSNVLFGPLQKITAQQINVSPVLMAAANSAGGVIGKMMSPQSIVVATTATNSYGSEGQILKKVFFHSVALVGLMGLLVYLQAYVFPFTKMVVH